MSLKQDYSSLLTTEFLQKRRKNPGYSLRAFARDLDISPAFLSQILSRKKNLSVDLAKKVALKIGWTSPKRACFNRLVELQNVSTGEPDMSWRIQQDQVECVAAWYHFALIEWAKIHGGIHSVTKVASAFDISVREVKDALERLVRIGLMTNNDSGYYATQRNYSAPDLPSEAVRSFHAAFLEKAKIAQELQSIDERDITGITVATDPERIADAKIMIRDFRRQLMDFLEGGKPSQVFHLGIQLFRLDK